LSQAHLLPRDAPVPPRRRSYPMHGSTYSEDQLRRT
jgi:hypothetical protein